MPTSTFTVVSGGRGRLQNVNGTYSTCRTASSASETVSDTGVVESASAYAISRYYAPFDLTSPTSGSAIPAGAVINSAFLRLVGTSKVDDNSDSIVVVGNTMASPTNLVQDDFDQTGSTSFGTLALSAYNTSGNNDITLNSSGLANISGGGYAKFAIRMNTRDLNNTAPAGNNVVNFTSGSTLLSIDWTASDIAAAPITIF